MLHAYIHAHTTVCVFKIDELLRKPLVLLCRIFHYNVLEAKLHIILETCVCTNLVFFARSLPNLWKKPSNFGTAAPQTHVQKNILTLLYLLQLQIIFGMDGE